MLPWMRKMARAAALLLPPLFPALLGWFHVLNADIGFHVATGRAIRLAGEVPTTNVLSFAQSDHPWVLHQWIPGVLFEWLDRIGGPLALVAVKCAVIYLTFLALWVALRKRLPAAPAAVLLVLAASASGPRFYVRPFLFSMLGLAGVLALLAWEEEHSRPRNLALIAGVLAITATLHAGVVYGLLLFGAYVMAHLVAWAVGRRPQVPFPALPVGFGLAALALVALAVTLESPWGLEALILPFRFSTNTYFHEHLAEFRPLPFDPARLPFAWALLLLTPALGILHTVRGKWRQAGPAQLLFEWLALLGFSYLVLKHQRIVYAYALVAAYVAAGWLRPLLAAPPSGRMRPGLLWSLAVVLALVGAGRQFSAARFGPGIDDRLVPRQMLSFVADQDLPDPAYVSDSWGGHWLWAFFPERRVFYDNRLEAYSYDFFRNQYQAIRYGEEGWQERLAAHEIKLLALKYSTPGERRFQEGRPNVRDLAFAGPDWQLIYWDELGQLFVPSRLASTACRGKPCPDWRYFNPDTLQPAADATPQQVWSELQQVWRQQPSARACFALVRILLAEGRREEAAGLLQQGLERFPDSPALQDLLTAF